MKAADISDEQVFAVVDAATASGRAWATMYDMRDALPIFPYKVILAKCAQMIRKGRMGGCPCGCRGDFARLPGPRKLTA